MFPVEYTASKNNVNIHDSYKVSKHDFEDALDFVKYDAEDSTDVFKNRSYFSMKMEWTAHNFLYMINYERERTGSVDLNYPQKWYITAAYVVSGLCTWLFIK